MGNFTQGQYDNIERFLEENQGAKLGYHPVHDRFVRNVANNLGRLVPNTEQAKAYHEVAFQNQEGVILGSIDLAVLTPDEFIIVEAKVRERHNWKNTWACKSQLSKYARLSMQYLGIKPTCIAAYKHINQTNNYKTRVIPIF
ncbi:MAG: hypothetical protein R6V53_04625 [Candidatus Woesearchaeota archaeon]